MQLILVFALFSASLSQISNPNNIENNATLSIFTVNNLSVYPDPSSIYYPQDKFVSIAFANTNIYVLQSSNIVQIYNKLNLASPLQNFTDYSYSHTSSYNFIYLSVNEQ